MASEPAKLCGGCQNSWHQYHGVASVIVKKERDILWNVKRVEAHQSWKKKDTAGFTMAIGILGYE